MGKPEYELSEESGKLIPTSHPCRVIATDFSAIGNLMSYAKDNSHIDTHFINDVFMVYHGWEITPIFDDSTNYYWLLIGVTMTNQ
eukprot:8593103-Ditylum_brightwellii.AAC.1